MANQVFSVLHSAERMQLEATHLVASHFSTCIGAKANITNNSIVSKHCTHGPVLTAVPSAAGAVLPFALGVFKPNLASGETTAEPREVLQTCAAAAVAAVAA